MSKGGVQVIYRMLALNIDGTLLRSNGRLTRETKEAIEYVAKKGVYITLVTSRNFQSTKKIAKALKLDFPLITHNGAFLASSIDVPIYERRINHNTLYDLIALSENYPCQVRIVHEKYSMINRQKDYMMAKFIIGYGEPVFYPIRYVESLTEQLQEEPVAPPNIDVYFPYSRDKEDFIMQCKKQFAGISIFEKDEQSIVITANKVSRYNSLQLLAKKYNVPLDQVVAIGNSTLDQEMIAGVGLGVAMGHAPEELKNSADWVTRTNDQNGVSYMVKEVFRKQMRVQI
jgi:Cof subfamily protein (haloacid dehalogenase superfamily)